ncbi:MAG: L-lactate permease, partial [Acidobacteriota bacterium]|nr:L-lactate permease [Acidobacteriota bacterium]
MPPGFACATCRCVSRICSPPESSNSSHGEARGMAPVWQQGYLLFGWGLAPSALLAVVPTVLLLVVLAVLRKPAWMAATAGLGAAVLLATGAYHMPVGLAASAATYGAAFGVFPISWIVFWALVLYEISVRTGKFEVIKQSLPAITADTRLQALLIAFAFGAFLEGCAGFGTPVAVASAMLVGLGFPSLYASQLCLLANTAPVAFGSIGIPVITLAGITGLPLAALSAGVGRICAPISLLLPAYLIAVTSGWAAMLEVWPAVLLAGASFAAVQFVVSNFVGPQLTDILASLAAMGGLVLLLRWWQPATPHTAAALQPAATSQAVGGAQSRHPGGPTGRQVFAAWVPYLLLVVFVLAWGYQPIAAHLNRVTASVPWPHLHNQVLRTVPVVRTPARYAAVFTFNWLSASGTSCMIASLFAALFAGMSPRQFLAIVGAVAYKLIRPTLTVAAMLAMAFVMNYS